MLISLIQPQMNNLLLFTWSVLLASSFYFSAEIVAYAPPIFNTWIRFVIATVCLFPLVAKQIKLYLHWQYVKSLLLATLCLVSFFLLFFESLQHTSAFNTSVIYTLLPVVTLILSALFVQGICLWQQLPLYILGSVGAVLLLWIVRPEGQNDWYWNWGDALFAVATLMLALHVVLMQRQSTVVPGVMATFLVLGIGSILLAPFTFVSFHQELQLDEARYWQLIFWLAIFSTTVTVLLQQKLIKRAGSSHFTAYSYLIPVLVAVMAGSLNTSNILLAIPALIIIIIALMKISVYSQVQQNKNVQPVMQKCRGD